MNSCTEPGSIASNAVSAIGGLPFAIAAAIAGPARRDDCVDVEDQSNVAIAENGGCRDSIDGAIVGFERLDNDLALADDLVDAERDPLMRVVLNEQCNIQLRRGQRLAIAQNGAEIDERNVAARYRQYF